MGREFELKYAADPGTLEAIAGQYAPLREIRMETTYYDDEGNTLSRLRWTLRRRLENGASICTLKIALPDGSRGEWEAEAADILQAVPRLIALGAPAELADIARGELTAVCGARFVRRAALLAAGAGQVELALDSGVLLGGGRELPFCEVEVEKKHGSDGDTRDFAEALARRYSLTPQPKSKLARARELRDCSPHRDGSQKLYTPGY